jgi:hypothetical protein
MDEWGQTLLIAAIIIVLGWFTLGLTWNLRKGNALLRWMQTGLPQLGERTTMRWLGSSAIELVIGKARSPFKQVTLLAVMEPRDIPWLWLISRFQHRRDVLIVRAQLQTVPLYEFDLIAPDAWSETKQAGQSEAQPWAVEPLDDLNFGAPSTTRSLSRAIAVDALPVARRVQPRVWRLSARRDDPQLEIHVPLPNLRQTKAQDFFTALRELGEQLGKRSTPPLPKSGEGAGG